MIISHSEKFIFIHNPKVAGCSLRFELSKYAERTIEDNKLSHFMMTQYYRKSSYIFFQEYGHLTALQVKKLSPKKLYDEYFKFGFVRNPWDREVSLYNYFMGVKYHDVYDLTKIHGLSFKEFLHWRVENFYLTQKEFFYDKKGNQIVDFIGRFEFLLRDFNKIKDKLQLDINLRHENKSNVKKKIPYINFYDEETLNFVYENFKEDCETFGYEYPELIHVNG